MHILSGIGNIINLIISNINPDNFKNCPGLALKTPQRPHARPKISSIQFSGICSVTN